MFSENRDHRSSSPDTCNASFIRRPPLPTHLDHLPDVDILENLGIDPSLVGISRNQLGEGRENSAANFLEALGVIAIHGEDEVEVGEFNVRADGEGGRSSVDLDTPRGGLGFSESGLFVLGIEPDEPKVPSKTGDDGVEGGVDGGEVALPVDLHLFREHAPQSVYLQQSPVMSFLLLGPPGVLTTSGASRLEAQHLGRMTSVCPIILSPKSV